MWRQLHALTGGCVVFCVSVASDMDTHPGNVQRKPDRGLLPPPHPLTGSPGKVAREPRWAQALCCLGMAGSWCGQTGCCLSSSHGGPPSPHSAALRWPAPTSRHTSLLSRGAVPLPEKSSVLSLLSLLLSQLLETTERIFIFFTISIVLPFPEYQIVGMIWYIDFSDWLFHLVII